MSEGPLTGVQIDKFVARTRNGQAIELRNRQPRQIVDGESIHRAICFVEASTVISRNSKDHYLRKQIRKARLAVIPVKSNVKLDYQTCSVEIGPSDRGPSVRLVDASKKLRRLLEGAVIVGYNLTTYHTNSQKKE